MRLENSVSARFSRVFSRSESSETSKIHLTKPDSTQLVLGYLDEPQTAERIAFVENANDVPGPVDQSGMP